MAEREGGKGRATWRAVSGTVQPILSDLWRELYQRYCAIRLAMGKWSMFQVQEAKGLSLTIGVFLQPVREGERDTLQSG